MDENYNLAQENTEDSDFGLTPEQEEKLFSDPAVQSLLQQVFGMKPNQEQENEEEYLYTAPTPEQEEKLDKEIGRVLSENNLLGIFEN